MASISRRGDGWLAQVRLKEAGRIVFSESKTFPTEAMARSWAQRLEAKVRKDGPAVAVGARMTVGDLIETHLAYQRKLRPLGRSTIANHEYMAQEFRKVMLGELRAKHLVDFAVRRRADDNAAPATILANLSALSAAVHAAPFAHGIQVDPTEVDLAMRRLREDGLTAKSREVIRIVSEAEEKALLEQFERRNSHHQTAIDMVLVYKMAIALPRRAGELTRMRWADIDPTRRTVVIRDVKHPKRKIGNDQVVPLLGDAWTLLEQIPKLDERVFPYDTDSVCAAFERTRDRIAETGMLGIKDLRFHDLRHTGITRLFQRGLSIQEVALVSGHSNWAQLKRYTHLQPEDLHKHFPDLAQADAAA
jgi:integrase